MKIRPGGGGGGGGGGQIAIRPGGGAGSELREIDVGGGAAEDHLTSVFVSSLGFVVHSA